jgi:DNA-binding transcriptional regulator/RsmH inhibitor MraZ
MLPAPHVALLSDEMRAFSSCRTPEFSDIGRVSPLGYSNQLCKVDIKGRFQLPAESRQGLRSEEKITAVVAASEMLWLFPVTEYAGLLAQIGRRGSDSENHRLLERCVAAATAATFALDSVGRMSLRHELFKAIGVSPGQGYIRVLARGWHYELWNPEAFERSMCEVTLTEISALELPGSFRRSFESKAPLFRKHYD